MCTPYPSTNNVNVLLHALQDPPCVLCATSIFTLFIIVTKLSAERAKVGMPVGTGDLLISEQVQTACGAIQPPLLCSLGTFLGGRAAKG